VSDYPAPESCDAVATAQPQRVAPVLDAQRAPVAQRLALVLGFWAAVALLYWPSALELDRLWTDLPAETYTHGYLILAISLWLIVRDRKQLALMPARFEPLALIPLALMSAAWVWFWRAAIQELQLLLLPLILYAALYAAVGRRIARALAFPIGFLYFALPFWSDLNGIVQGLSAKVNGVLIALTGIPAYMAGDFAHLPGGSIEIAASCSGLHTLIVGLALAALYGKVSGEPRRRRLVWLLSMGALSLAVNWVRIFTVLVAAYETDMRSSLVKQHYWLGWWLFAFAFAGFLWWTGRRSTAPDSVPAVDEGRSPSADLGIRTAPVLVTLAVLAGLPALAYGMDWASSTAAHAAVAIQWPAAPAGWSGPAAAGAEWKPYFVHPSGESLTRYTDPAGAPVEAFSVAYRVQTQRAKLLGYWNHLLGRAKGLRQQPVRVLDSPGGPWREMLVIDSAGSRSLLWIRYRVGERLFVKPRASQLWYGLEAIVKPPVSSLTALRTPCLPDCKAARARLSGAAPWLRPALR
jgi:exosortase